MKYFSNIYIDRQEMLIRVENISIPTDKKGALTIGKVGETKGKGKLMLTVESNQINNLNELAKFNFNIIKMKKNE